MACGCGDRCTCSVIAGSNITVTGSGDTISPYIITAAESNFAATNGDGAIHITAAGPQGHTPDFEVNVSPDGGNLLSKHSNGLYVDPAGAIAVARFIGEIIEATGLSTPALTLEADAGEHAVTAFPLLASEYGATGAGDGVWDNHPQLGLPATGNFRVPDLRDRQTIGQGHIGAVGATDGITETSRSNAHTHTGSAHTHGLTAASVSGSTTDHAFTIETGVGGGATQSVWDDVGVAAGDPGSINAVSVVSSIASTHHHDFAVAVGGSTDSAGGGATSSATIPYAVVRKVVFAGA